MAEEDLKKAILERIQKEKKDILAEARESIEATLKQARDEAASLKEAYLAGLRKNCLLKKTKELSKIHLEAERQLLEAKEKKISEVLSRVREHIKTIQKDRERYKSIFKSLLLEALDGFDKKNGLKLKVNPSDRKLGLEALREFKLDMELETKDSIGGGLELSNLDETITIVNTFSSRLEKISPELRQEVSEILFGKL